MKRAHNNVISLNDEVDHSPTKKEAKSISCNE